MDEKDFLLIKDELIESYRAQEKQNIKEEKPYRASKTINLGEDFESLYDKFILLDFITYEMLVEYGADKIPKENTKLFIEALLDHVRDESLLNEDLRNLLVSGTGIEKQGVFELSIKELLSKDSDRFMKVMEEQVEQSNFFTLKNKL